jgi:hypothetical protein
MKTKTEKKTGGSKAAKRQLTLTVIIPGAAVPLFRAVAAMEIENRPTMVWERARHGHPAGFYPRPPWTESDVATFAVVRWLVSDDCQDRLTKTVNGLLHRV